MRIPSLPDKVIDGGDISFAEACQIINTSDEDTFGLLFAANQIRQHFKGNKIKLCAITNAKSGRCPEDCVFCAQSAHYKTSINAYPLVSPETILQSAKAAEQEMSATCFSIVTAGRGIQSDSELNAISKAVSAIKEGTRLNRCVSAGVLTEEKAQALKAAGLRRYNHNLETAASYFEKICTTQSYQERVNTLKALKKAGLGICSGGIFGLGESLEQRVELAFALKELDVESIPINVLNPIPGTPAENYLPLTPLEVLRLVATYRFILPDKDIGVFGGRERALRDLQPLMYIAGANQTLIGNYLTTKGRPAEEDLKIIRDLGLEIDG